MSELATTIGTLLQRKSGSGEVWSASPNASVYQAIEIMADKKIGALPVMQDGALLGVISERDYARKVILQGRSSKDTRVIEIMTSPVIFISPKHTVGECMRIMSKNRIRHLPVLDNGRVMGIITIGDLVNWIITEQEKTIQHLESYISGTPA